MSWCRWVTDKAYGAVNYAYSQTDHYLISPLTAIAKAVYHSESASHLAQGFNQIFRLPEILSISPRTRAIVKESLLTNGEYLLDTIASERLIHKVYPHYEPIYSETVGAVLDWVILIGFTARLFVRHILDNNCFALSLPHAVSNDLADYLAKVYAESLAGALWKGFKSHFFRYSELNDSINERAYYAKFVSELESAFAEFIAQRDITDVSFKKLQKTLAEIINNIIAQSGSSVPDKVVKKFSKTLAGVIKDEFFYGLMKAVPTLAKKFKIKSLENTDEIIERQTRDKNNLSTIMSKTMFQAGAEQYADELIRSVIKVNASNKDNLQSWMPLNNIDACDCEKKKKIHASLSTSLYYTGNLIWLSLLRKATAFLPDTQRLAALLTLFLYQAIVYGQSVNEYKVVGDGQCTYHRYRVFSRNKAHSLGVGLSYTLSVELLAKLVYFMTGVDNFFTRDALVNLTLQLVAITTLADNKPLPGTGINTWDIFSGPRKLTRKAAETIHGWFIPDLNNLESRQRCVERIKSILRSRGTSAVVLYFLDGDNYYPTQASLDQIKIALGEKLYPSYYLAKNEPRPDMLVVLFHIPAVKTLLKLYQQHIDQAIPMLDSAHAWSKSLAGPLLSLPLPSALASTVTIPLLFLKDESLYALIRKLEAQMLLLRAPVDKTKKALTVTTAIKPLASVETLKIDEKYYSEARTSIKEESLVPVGVKVEEMVPITAVLPAHTEYRESDLNKIDGFEFVDITPHTERAVQKKKDAAGLAVYGMFAPMRVVAKKLGYGRTEVAYELKRI